MQKDILMKNYEFTFSIKGFGVFFAVMLPNILWIAYPPANDILTTNLSDYTALNNTMFISQWIMFALLMILSRKIDTEIEIESESSTDTFYIVSCTILLIGYYIFWVLYYMSITSSIVFMGMAIFPSVFFIMFSLLEKNNIALFPAIIYALLNIGITYSNLP